MRKKTAEEWEQVRIPKGLLNNIKDFLESNQAKELGYTSASQVAVDAIRELLIQHNPQMRHFNIQDNIIRVVDIKIDNNLLIEIFHKNNLLRCSYCEKVDCEHIKFLWEDPNLVKEFKKLGLKPPV
ncbi:hypothetical protein FJZ21_04030 [Candidatus Pacearchaeota archaeon]|nr:hypothetical protein [Candidatus Pacearchaeota archaeon]